MKLIPSHIFYTEFARSYHEYARMRTEYLSAIDRFIVHEARPRSRIVDVGAGDGTRSARLSSLLGSEELTLIDNSEGMLEQLRKIPKARVIRADISSSDFANSERYHAVLCLWNVLGHIRDREGRLRAFKNLRDLLADSGAIFLDVNNRHNFVQYGLLRASKNLLADLLPFRKNKGIFKFSIHNGVSELGTEVYISTQREIRNLVWESGLKIEKMLVIDYKTGRHRRSVFTGQLVYKLTKR